MNPCATLAIDPEDPAPVYAQLAGQIRSKIFDGQISFSERLPATRQLARTLGVSRRTIVTVFEMLISEGLLETRHGDGTYCVYDDAVSARTGQKLERSNDGTQFDLEKAYEILPLSPRGIDPGALSIKAWSAAAARAQRSLSASSLFGSMPGGLPRLKEALTKHLLSLRGLNVEPSQVIVTAGIRESLDLVTELLPPLKRVGVEEPSNTRIRALIGTTDGSRTQFLPLPVDQKGAGFATISSVTPADAVLVTPSHQYPMGITLSHARRLELVERLHGTPTWVLEDDYGAAVRYSGANIRPIFHLDSRDRTVYFGTLSSILFSNLHLSFIVVPKDQVDATIRIQHRKGSLASILAQAAVAEFMECGAFAQHLLDLRRYSHANYTALFDEVRTKLSEWLEPIPIDGGVSFAALAHDASFDDQSIALLAKAAGLSPKPLSNMYVDPSAVRPGLVFGFMGTAPNQSRAAVDRLRTILTTGSR
ncbi:MAG: PLP-dependent aminotransferase family protein [Pseudomonadota bacterium]